MECNDDYISKLGSLDFTIEKKDFSSIYLVGNQSKYIEQEESPYIIIALDKAIEFDADAVYFRLFDDGRPPLAQIYIYDNIQKKRTSDDYKNIHKAIWSGCEISVYMIIDKTEIKMFDGRKNFDFFNSDTESQYIDIINFDIQNDILKKYNAQLFNNGTFWETDIANNHFLNNTGAAERLLKSLKEVRDKFKRHIKKQPELSDRLLIMCILVKYLEENGIDPETNRNLASEFFQKSTGFNTLKDVLYNNKLTYLLKDLSGHFNGGIFSLNDRENPDRDVYSDIDNIDQKKLAVFFDAGSSENLFGWSDYSFEHIPVELISNLYEEFLPKEKNKQGKNKETPENGAVYTPSFLVNFLIDECLPLNYHEINENIKLLDPACGSGIFLVTAYKRLIQRWRIKNINENKLADPEPDTLKQILKNNIFGIDIHYNSVHLTIFSLQLALCSMLKPKQIWTKKGLFNDLEKDGNIIEKDFFCCISEESIAQDFDLIIGNPPFKELPKKEFIVYKEKLEKYNINLNIPRYQEALLFLSASLMLLKNETGKLCLIQKSGPFLYSEEESSKEKGNLSFRMSLFKQFSVSQIIDFSLIKKDLFKANVDTIAVFINNKLPENDSISHIVIRKTRSVAEKSYFELCHYDFHEIPSHIAVSDSYAWKCNLFSGTQVYNLVKRLKSFQNLKDYLDIKRREGWDYGQGYIIGNKKIKDKNKVISGKKTIIDRYFKDDGIKKLEIQKEMYFKDIPVNAKQIFSPPHLVIKKTIGKNYIPIELRDDYLTFRNEILGIHCPKKQRNELLLLEKHLRNNNDLLRMFIAATSARSGISRSIFTSELCDLLNIPLFFKKLFNPNITEKIIIHDILNYYIEEIRIGENSAIHKKIADKEKHIKPFSKVYCDSLNKIYAKKDGRKYHFIKLIEGCSFYICEYKFGFDNNFNYITTNENLDNILISWNSNFSVKYSKIMRNYGDNIIRLIKPKKLLFWLQSTALRDFDDTLEDSLHRDDICKSQ